MNHEPSKEYLLLFNAITDYIQDVQELLACVVMVDRKVRALSKTGKEGDAMDAIALLVITVSSLIPDLQVLQLNMIQAQQKAEALFMEAE